MWADSHCHLPGDGSAGEVLAAARDAGVGCVVTIGTDAAESRAAIALAAAYDDVWATVGLHPHDAKNGLDDVIPLLDEPKVVAVGECGLDHHRDHARPANQRRAFSAQIALAREVGLPLVIHTRDAARETLDMLAAEAAGHPVVLHCFSLPEHLDEVVARGYVLSFAGPVTFPKSLDLQRAARDVPAELLLVETDSPYLAPVPRRGRPNRPANVAHTLRFIADLRGVTEAELDELTSANAARVFGW